MATAYRAMLAAAPKAPTLAPAEGNSGEPARRKTMTLYLTEEEMAALDDLVRKKDLEPPKVFRQALKLYQLQEAGLVRILSLDESSAFTAPTTPNLAVKELVEAARPSTKPNWALCPSTHCERRQDCASPHECTDQRGGRKALLPGFQAYLEAEYGGKLFPVRWDERYGGLPYSTADAQRFRDYMAGWDARALAALGGGNQAGRGGVRWGEAVTKAEADVIAERRRQVEVEGWTPEHDDEHAPGELSLAGAAYAVATRWVSEDLIRPPTYWPWDRKWWKPGPARRMLVKAAALIIAEIERLDRQESRHG
jgi:hypothetical protein